MSSDGQVRWVSPNIVTSVVTVEHDPVASLRQMHKALGECGFEVCGITTSTGDISDLDLGEMRGESSDDTGVGPSTPVTHPQQSILSRWFMPSRLPARNPETFEAHLKNCAHCRGSEERRSHELGSQNDGFDKMQQIEITSHFDIASKDTSTSESRPGTQPKPFVAVESSEVLPSNPIWRATVAIGGMTCAKCTNSITESLRNREWISSVTVSLISNSATVDLIDKDKADDLVKAIEDLGYEAALDAVTSINNGKRKRREGSDMWRATVSIEGMTCASCAGKIAEQMKKKEWVKDITVNLLSNSATVDFQGQENVAKLAPAIEELGFDAVSDTVVSLDDPDDDEVRPPDNQRTVDIRIDGLYCPHCPTRVVKSLAGFRRQLEVLSAPTLQKKIMKIQYVPDAPAFTIRHILAAIDASDPSLKASLYHPPTLEERSKQMQSRHRRQILWRTVFSGVVAIPTFVIGIVYMSLLPMEKKHFMMDSWVSGINRTQISLFILATLVYFLGADVFHRRAIKEISALWRPGSRVPILQRFLRFGSMNMLMSLGTTIAYLSSICQMIAVAVAVESKKAKKADDSNFYFDSVVFLTFFLLLGRLIESYSKSRTGEAVEALVKLRPTTATLVQGYGTEKERDEEVTADQLDHGDVVRVKSGGSPPSDGVIVEGTSNFDESSLTGESRPVKKAPGDEVFSGTVNKEASVLVRITGASGNSLLDQIVNIVREGQTKRAPIEQVADYLTSYFVPAITLTAVSTWLIWLGLGLGGVLPKHYLETEGNGWVPFALQFSIAVFVVACPCGLGLAAPTAIFVGAGLAARFGILAKGGGEAFQKASRIDCVVFDKTGTLTVGGEPSITDSEVYRGSDDEKASVLAALRAVEENSSHPIAKAIVSFCKTDEKSSKVSVESMEEIPGKGMRAIFQERTPGQLVELIVGNEALMEDFSVVIPSATTQKLLLWKQEAKSVALVATKSALNNDSSPVWILAAILAISDPIRPEAVLVIHALQGRGTQVWMLSGDNPTTAVAVAQQLGIAPDQVIAGVLPAGKAEKITFLQSTLKKRTGKNTESATERAMVAMVGDGINDSPALTTADVGIAIGSGSDVAISSADFVLMKSDLKAVVTLLDLSATVLRRIKFNFGWAVVYNMIAIPVAAGAFFPIENKGQHVKLDPAWASLAMALSSISVVVSSLLLKTKILGYRERRLSST